jgi:hypothetical protein
MVPTAPERRPATRIERSHAAGSTEWNQMASRVRDAGSRDADEHISIFLGPCLRSLHFLEGRRHMRRTARAHRIGRSRDGHTRCIVDRTSAGGKYRYGGSQTFWVFADPASDRRHKPRLTNSVIVRRRDVVGRVLCAPSGLRSFDRRQSSVRSWLTRPVLHGRGLRLVGLQMSWYTEKADGMRCLSARVTSGVDRRPQAKAGDRAGLER